MAKSGLNKSFIYAFKGIGFALKERNFKIHILAAIIVLVFGFYLKISNDEWVTVLLCIGGVMSLEIINTAIELLVDKISPERNETAGKIKDLAAGAVLIFSIISAIIGLLIFLPYFIK